MQKMGHVGALVALIVGAAYSMHMELVSRASNAQLVERSRPAEMILAGGQDKSSNQEKTTCPPDCGGKGDNPKGDGRK